MRNIETLTTKTGPDDAGLNILLTEARLEERRARAEAMAARLDSLACHITSRQLNHVEAAELLRVTAEAIQNEAQEIQYNEMCQECRQDCKQSFRCQVVECPKFRVRRSRKKK